jgi:hypothetical protein
MHAAQYRSCFFVCSSSYFCNGSAPWRCAGKNCSHVSYRNSANRTIIIVFQNIVINEKEGLAWRKVKIILLSYGGHGANYRLKFFKTD